MFLIFRPVASSASRPLSTSRQTGPGPRNRRAFTLLELLVTVVIVGLLASIALPSFLASSQQARYSEAKTQMGKLKTVLLAYYNEYGRFPEDIGSRVLPDEALRSDWKPADSTYNSSYDYDSYRVSSGSGGCYIQIVFSGANGANLNAQGRDTPINTVLFPLPGLYSSRQDARLGDDLILSLGVFNTACPGSPVGS